MTTLPEKSQQILQAHAALIHGVVMACQNRALLVQLEPVLKMSEENGWSGLIGALRKIINGRRDISVLGGLDEEDRVIVEAVLRGIQDPATLPDPLAKTEATHAAPGLASMISAASRGDVPALQALGNMAEQMLPVGGDMARLGGIRRYRPFFAINRHLNASAQPKPGAEYPRRCGPAARSPRSR